MHTYEKAIVVLSIMILALALILLFQSVFGAVTDIAGIIVGASLTGFAIGLVVGLSVHQLKQQKS